MSLTPTVVRHADDTSGPLTTWSATSLHRALHAGDVSAREVVGAFLDRIDELNPRINAVVSRLPAEAALAEADRADARRLAGEPIGVLHGLPVAVKDLSDAAGLRTTLGSRAFADAPPAELDAPFVARMRAAGAIVVGKTNAAEYGVGALAHNEVFGVTRNPYDLDRHSGGSTGGAAAVAADLLPFSDGSDSGGSIRVPAAFCNVVGLRTTLGVVPGKGHANCWDPHAVQGPMARDSRDAALLLAGMSGADPANPTSWWSTPTAPVETGAWGDAPVRLAWSDDLGGVPVSAEMRAAMAATRALLEGAGVEVVDVALDLSEADFAWPVIEKFDLMGWGGPQVLARPDLYGAEMVRNVREATALEPGQLGYAKHLRYTLYARTAAALVGFDALVAPTTPVVAPPAEATSVWEVDGSPLERYYDWQALATRLALTAHPVLALPAGFTTSGLPYGMQLAGPLGSDRRLLALGDRLESILGVHRVRPVL
ncbi:amidase [Cellulomonas alba]|uniref:Amidase n=1 Tax=Cellulomonas alba TaxID=3053467 RepID=A0ABT7SCJ4_9CELL|nr:amidase [Cellulomonas alba]MDM7853912.1 amidase [Cellulomonas alba]